MNIEHSTFNIEHSPPAIRPAWLLKSAVTVVLALLVCSGCTALPPEQYMQYMDNNRERFCETIERNGIKAVVCYRPNEYYAARDMVGDSTLTAERAMARYANSLFFVLAVSSEQYGAGSVLLEKDGAQGFGRNVLTNTFSREEDIFLLNAGDQSDTVDLAQYHYERNWGIGNDDTFLMAFPRERVRDNESEYRLMIRDLLPELGTIDLRLGSLMKATRKLKG